MQKILVLLLLIGVLPCSAQSLAADTTEGLSGLSLINHIFPSHLVPDTSAWSPFQKHIVRLSGQNTAGCISATSLGLLDSAGCRHLYRRLEELATTLYQAGTPLLIIQGTEAGSRAKHLNQQGNPYGITYYGSSSCLITKEEMEAARVFNHVTYTLTGYQSQLRRGY